MHCVGEKGRDISLCNPNGYIGFFDISGADIEASISQSKGVSLAPYYYRYNYTYKPLYIYILVKALPMIGNSYLAY